MTMHLAGDSYCDCQSRLSAVLTGPTGEDLRLRWGIWVPRKTLCRAHFCGMRSAPEGRLADGGQGRRTESRGGLQRHPAMAMVESEAAEARLNGTEAHIATAGASSFGPTARSQGNSQVSNGNGHRREAPDRHRVPVQLGVQPRAGRGEGAGRRGTLGRPARPCVSPSHKVP